MNIALLLSGGTGVRLGADIPKQYIEVGGRPVISFSIERLSRHEGIDGIQIAADSSWHGAISEWLRRYDPENKFKGFSVPGKNRQLSIWNGLEDIKAYAGSDDCILIHDAARPLLSEELISRCLETMEGYEGVLPVLSMKDTVYSSADGKKVGQLLDRSRIYAGQAPEAFLLGPYYEANRYLLPDEILKINGSTEPAVLAGMNIAMIPGDENNFKITTKGDLERFRKIMDEEGEAGADTLRP